MTTWVNVARYHLVDRLNHVALPWSVLAFAFVVNVIIAVILQSNHVGGTEPHYTGGLATIYVFLFVAGLLSITRALPFGLALGVSRRTYYLGTVALAVTLAFIYGLALTVLQAIEQATGGWGASMHFFRVPWILDGPWYVTWLTSFVVLAALFLYGIWFGLVYRRWNLIGLVTFLAAQISVLLAGALVVTWAQAWPDIAGFFATLSPQGLTGVLAALALVLAAGGFRTMRRVTV